MKIKNACSRKIDYVTPEEINQILAEQSNKILHFANYDFLKDEKRLPVSLSAGSCCICDLDVTFSVTTKFEGNAHTFICFKDEREYYEGATGSKIFQEFSNYWRVPRQNPEGISASPLLGYNPEYEFQRIEAWSYDLNSAYSDAMLQGWIDISKPPVYGIIDPETEIGFAFDEEDQLYLKRSGVAPFIFKKCDTPKGVRDYIIKWYSKKKRATVAGNQEEKIIAKQHLNYVVGYFQRVNPWLRAWIVCSCNERIADLLDENSLYWNTDSICSRVRRPDLEENLGHGVGQWKMDHSGVVAYRGLAYQWNMEKPTYRGVAKSWFKDGWDILKDEIPKAGNLWDFNKETLRLEATEWQEL